MSRLAIDVTVQGDTFTVTADLNNFYAPIRVVSQDIGATTGDADWDIWDVVLLACRYRYPHIKWPDIECHYDYYGDSEAWMEMSYECRLSPVGDDQ